jgi:hypothetical protein
MIVILTAALSFFGPVSGPRSYPARYFDRDYIVTHSRLG